MKSDVSTPDEYIASLPAQHRETLEKLRALVLKHLPKGYEEVMRWGAITYEVPLSVYPDTYNGEPLMYVALGAKKRHVGVYLCGAYLMPELREKLVTQWEGRGTRMDMGKSCLRITRWDKCEPDLIAEVISAVPMKRFVEFTKAQHSKKK